MSEDILQKADSLLDDLSDEPDQTEGGNPCQIRKNLIEMVPALVAEIKRLRGVADYLENAIGKPTDEWKSQEERLAAKDAEIFKWQEIARDERAQRIQDAQSGDFVNAQGEHIFQIADLAECRKQAAKELDIQISQEDSYLDRLEKKFLQTKNELEYYRNREWLTRDQMSQIAQAALEKIRHVD